MSISTLARLNVTVETCPTLAVDTVPVMDSVIPAAPGWISRNAQATLPPDGVSSHDARYGCPLTFVVVVPEAMTVPPELRSCTRMVPAALRYASNLATVPAEATSARFQFVDPDAESPAAGTESRNRVSLFVAVPPDGTVQTILAAFSVGMPSEPRKSVFDARDRPACPAVYDWTAFEVVAADP